MKQSLKRLLNAVHCVRGKPRLSRVSNAIGLSVLSFGLTQGTANAIPIVVTSLLDGTANDCTLRDAIVSINVRDLQADCEFANVVGTDLFDSITFASNLSPSTSTITLVGGQLTVNPDTDFTIYGDGITVNANNQSRVFFASSATLTINNMTIIGGSASIGAGLYAGSSSLSLTDSRVSNNSASLRGGGLFVSDSPNITLSRSNLSNNSAEDGGGFFTQSSTISLNSSVVSGNKATHKGAGFNAQASSSVVIGSTTLSGNSAYQGGGFHVDSSNITIGYSTLSSNTASVAGGGFYVGPSAYVRSSNNTLSGNSAGYYGGGFSTRSVVSLFNNTLSNNFAGIYGGGLMLASLSNISIKNSIVANSRGSSDCFLVSGASAGIVNSDSASIIEAGNCTVDARSVDPGLLPLRNNGGRTKTHALSAGSQARDTGIPITCRTFDQRNQRRFGSGDPGCDVGAIEFNPNDDDGGFFVVPLTNGKVVVIPL